MMAILKQITAIIVLVQLCSGCALLERTFADPVETAKREVDTTGYTPLGYRDFFTDTTLLSLLDSAVLNNPDLLAAYQRIEIARADLAARHFAIFPQMQARVSAGQRRFGAYTMDGVGNFDTNFSPNISEEQKMPEHLPDFFAGLQASWEIDIWRRLRNGREAARERYLQQAEARNWVLSNLVASIASTYYELLSLDNELIILEEFIRLQENAELIISYQKMAGQATELAVQQFKAQTLSSKNMRVEALQKVVQAENRLNYLLGRFPLPVRRDPDAFNDSLQDLPVVIPPSMIRNRPDIVRAEHGIREAKLNFSVAEAALYPRLSLDVLAGFQSFNPGFFLSPASITYNLFGSMVAPLVNRAPLKAALRVTGSRQRNALYEYQKSVLNAYSEVSTEIANLQNLTQMLTFKSQEAEVSANAVITANALFRTGRATYLEVIITQKNALLTQLQLVNLRERRFKAAISLYKALGGGWR